METVQQLINRISKTGIKKGYLERVLPDWAMEYPPESETGLLELKVQLAKELGLSLASLQEGGNVFFGSLPSQPMFKRMQSSRPVDLSAAASMFYALARALISATPNNYQTLSSDPATIRDDLKQYGPVVNLPVLLEYLWERGIPVAHYSDWPDNLSRPAGMAVDVDGRPAILLGGSRLENAWHAFYLAHEMGHLGLGHVGRNQIIVDVESDSKEDKEEDEQEREADSFGLKLLGGVADIHFDQSIRGVNAVRNMLKQISLESCIDRGHLALRYAKESGRWGDATATLKTFEPSCNAPVVVNGDFASSSLDWKSLSEERSHYLRRVLALT